MSGSGFCWWQEMNEMNQDHGMASRALAFGDSWATTAFHKLMDLAGSPTNIFAPHATPAHSIDSLSMLVLAVTLGIFVAVAGMLAFALVRFRARKGDPDGEPEQVYGSSHIEVLWTVIPILILVVLFMATMRVISVTESVKKPASALDVVVIGHQFWWEYRYPKQGIVTANELHIPLAKGTNGQQSYLTMSSADVDHSYWIPELAGKMDLIPNKTNVMWMDPQKSGVFLGQCAQYCGTEHAKMLLRVYVDTPEQFAHWVDDQRKPAVNDPSAEEGRVLFQHLACVNCHAVQGTDAKGRFGPDLTHLASRDTIGSGVAKNTPANLRKWLDDPDSIKPGSLMPKMNLNGHELDVITAYMASLK